MVEEIIARNTAKAVDAEQEYALEQTPIEALIEEKRQELARSTYVIINVKASR